MTKQRLKSAASPRRRKRHADTSVDDAKEDTIEEAEANQANDVKDTDAKNDIDAKSDANANTNENSADNSESNSSNLRMTTDIAENSNTEQAEMVEEGKPGDAEDPDALYLDEPPPFPSDGPAYRIYSKQREPILDVNASADFANWDVNQSSQGTAHQFSRRRPRFQVPGQNMMAYHPSGYSASSSYPRANFANSFNRGYQPMPNLMYPRKRRYSQYEMEDAEDDLLDSEYPNLNYSHTDYDYMPVNHNVYSPPSTSGLSHRPMRYAGSQRSSRSPLRPAMYRRRSPDEVGYSPVPASNFSNYSNSYQAMGLESSSSPKLDVLPYRTAIDGTPLGPRSSDGRSNPSRPMGVPSFSNSSSNPVQENRSNSATGRHDFMKYMSYLEPQIKYRRNPETGATEICPDDEWSTDTESDVGDAARDVE